MKALRSIAHYRIETELGRGGMGVVYLAWDEKLERKVALKLLSLAAGDEQKARDRILREARSASRLNHPHICTVHEVGEAEGLSYIAMEFVEGDSLADLIPVEGLSADLVVRYGSQIASAIAHAHEQGVVHRDIKPLNVRVTKQGRIKVLDFGLSRRLASGPAGGEAGSIDTETAEEGIAGTPHYMSPEVLRGEPATSGSDIWALGVLLYQMASGTLPFRGRTGYEASSAILREPPGPLPRHVPAALRSIIQHCLSRDPGERYQQAVEVRAALEAATPGLSEDMREAPEPVIRPRRGRRALWTASVAVGVLLAAAAVVYRYGLSTLHDVPAADAKIQTLAILPLKPLGRAAESEDLGLGIADSLITAVSRIGELTVRPSSAVRKFGSADVDVLEAARQLKVESVLEGTVQRSGEHVRVNVNLLRVQDETSLWSESFDVILSDIFGMQDEIARQVAGKLRLRLSAIEKAQLGKRYTSSARAYEHYLKGMRSLDRRGLTIAERAPLEEAISHFGRALEEDPSYALARAQLAYAYVWMALFADPSSSWMDKAREEMTRAETLDPNLAELHLVRHEILWSIHGGFKTAEAARELKKAQSINPAVGHEQLGVLYAHMGLLEPSLKEEQRAMEIDPESELCRARLVEVYDLLVLPDEAIDRNRQFGNLPLPASFLRKSYMWKQDFASAEANIDRTLARNPEDPFAKSNRALLEAVRGKFREAELLMAPQVERARTSRAFHHVAYNAASIHALQGNAAEAVQWLGRTVDAGMPNHVLFSKDPHLDRIRAHPAFVRFMSDQKTVWDGYVREFGSP